MKYEYTAEVQLMINKTLACGFKTFINNLNELIIIPKINLYFRLEDVKTQEDFESKILKWCTQKAASNHWNKYWSPKIIKYINYMLGTQFINDEIDLIYCKLGNGINHELTMKFIESNFDLSILESNKEE